MSSALFVPLECERIKQARVHRGDSEGCQCRIIGQIFIAFCSDKTGGTLDNYQLAAAEKMLEKLYYCIPKYGSQNLPFRSFLQYVP